MATREKDPIKQLITKAALLDQRIKADTKILTEGKESLVDWYTGLGEDAEKCQEGYDGATATFSAADVFDPISVEDLKNMLTVQGKADKLLDCMAVNMTSLRKILGAEDIALLQGKPIGTKYSLRLKVK